MIKKLNTEAISQICANQIIPDISAVVKELLENSLDAGASSIEIVFHESGKDKIEVKDNGSGIKHENFSILAQKGATSKLQSFEEIDNVASYGFRGEALFALNQMSDLTIMTKTKEDENG